MPGRVARLLLLMLLPVLAAATVGALPARAQEPNDPRATAATSLTGLDVSWPQCGWVLPETTSYAVIGVNGGTAANTNPCLADQLRWASTATTGAAPGQPRVQLYVNTANPGAVLEEYGVTTWPTDNIDGRGSDSFAHVQAAHRNPYGRCALAAGGYEGFANDLACSWQYGWNRAIESVDDRFAPAARAAGVSDVAADYTWWLDVETVNSWQRGEPGAHVRNAAALEGMAQFYAAEGVTVVGLYSTHYQWDRIVGDAIDRESATGHRVGSNLMNAPSWLAGALNPTAAQLRCDTLTGLTGGPVVMNQYIADNLDHNHSCT